MSPHIPYRLTLASFGRFRVLVMRPHIPYRFTLASFGSFRVPCFAECLRRSNHLPRRSGLLPYCLLLRPISVDTFRLATRKPLFPRSGVGTVFMPLRGVLELDSGRLFWSRSFLPTAYALGRSWSTHFRFALQSISESLPCALYHI